MVRVVILGASFGGISTAFELRQLLDADKVEIVLVDKTATFTAGFRKLWDLVGHGVKAEGTRTKASLEERLKVKVIQDEVTAIDAANKSVKLAKQDEPLKADYLVVALGSETRMDLVPGLQDHGEDMWAFRNLPKAVQKFQAFQGGALVVLVGTRHSLQSNIAYIFTWMSGLRNLLLNELPCRFVEGATALNDPIY